MLKPMRGLLFVLVGLAAGCMNMKSPEEIELASYKEAVSKYTESVTDDKGVQTVPESEYYAHLTDIAKQFHQNNQTRVFRLLAREAVKQEHKEPNLLGEMKMRVKAGDTTLMGMP